MIIRNKIAPLGSELSCEISQNSAFEDEKIIPLQNPNY